MKWIELPFPSLVLLSFPISILHSPPLAVISSLLSLLVVDGISVVAALAEERSSLELPPLGRRIAPGGCVSMWPTFGLQGSLAPVEVMTPGKGARCLTGTGQGVSGFERGCRLRDGKRPQPAAAYCQYCQYCPSTPTPGGGGGIKLGEGCFGGDWQPFLGT